MAFTYILSLNLPVFRDSQDAGKKALRSHSAGRYQGQYSKLSVLVLDFPTITQLRSGLFVFIVKLKSVQYKKKYRFHNYPDYSGLSGPGHFIYAY